MKVLFETKTSQIVRNDIKDLDEAYMEAKKIAKETMQPVKFYNITEIAGIIINPNKK